MILALETAMWNREDFVLVRISNGEAHRGVVSTEQLGDYGVVVSDDARIQLFARLQLGNEVVVDLLLNSLRLPTAGSQFRQRYRPGHRGNGHR